MGFGLLLWILLLPGYSECTCTLPAYLTGNWISSEEGTLTFTSTTINNYQTTIFGTLTFSCFISSGSQFVLKTPSFPYLSLTFEAYLCLVLTEQSSSKYTYFLGSEENNNAGYDRLKTSNPSTNLTLADVCDRTSYPTGTHSVLIKEGEIANAREACSADLQAVWSYTYDDGSGNQCSGNSTSADVCTDTTAISLDYSECSQAVMYSSGGNLYCVYELTYGDNTYINLYNADSSTDESTTYRYTCLVMTKSDTVRYVTQYPKQCLANQTSTSVTSPGASLVLSLTSSCPTDPVSYAATVALAVVIPIIIIITAIIISYFCWKQNEKKKIEEAAKPDPKFVNGEIRNRRKNIHDGVIHPDQNGNLIRRESSVIISVPTSSRENYDPSPLSDIGDYGQDIDSDDDDYEVKDLNEFSLNDDIPRIVVQSATPNPPNSVSDGTVDVGVVAAGAVGMDVNSAKKKKRRRRLRKKSAKSRTSQFTNDEKDMNEGVFVKSLKYSTSDAKSKRTPHLNRVSHLNTKDKITFGTSTLLLKIPEKCKKKRKKYRMTSAEDNGMPVVDEKEKEVVTADVKEESLREKAYKMRVNRGEKLADLAKKRKKMPVLKHPMETQKLGGKGVVKSNSWLTRSNTPKVAAADSNIDVETADTNISTPRRNAWKQQNWCYDQKGVVVGRKTAW